MLDIIKIMEVLQQRYPFLLVDRIIDYKQNEYAVGCKNVSANEFWAQGHFEGKPIYPGVFIIESSAQTGAFIFYDKDSSNHNVFGMLSSVPYFKFIRPVVPGDQLMIKAELIERFSNMAKVKIKVTVDEKRVAEGELTYVFSK